MWKGVGDELRETEMDEAIQWYKACSKIAKVPDIFLRDAAARESFRHVMDFLTESTRPPEGGGCVFTHHSFDQFEKQ